MVDTKLVIDASETIAKAVRTLIDNMRPPRISPHRLRVGLYLTIAEQFEAGLQLVRMGMASHASVHVRSMLEGLVYMNLLGKSNKYVDQMIYNQLKGEKKMYESLLQSENIPAESRQIIQAKLDECKPRFDAKHAAGFRPNKISDDIVEAGLVDLIVPYTMLCGFSHNDVAVLALRHQGDKAMTYMAPVLPEVVVFILSIAMRVIVSATQPLSQIALYPKDLFEAEFQNMNNAWGGVLAAESE